ncbi:MAG: hypothetical protein DRJ51_04830 [Thermoprotei archaeon]|nr:MAG: hypothetical protein DRJ51_04830 [Thermoprotei archaeon]
MGHYYTFSFEARISYPKKRNIRVLRIGKSIIVLKGGRVVEKDGLREEFNVERHLLPLESLSSTFNITYNDISHNFFSIRVEKVEVPEDAVALVERFLYEDLESGRQSFYIIVGSLKGDGSVKILKRYQLSSRDELTGKLNDIISKLS